MKAKNYKLILWISFTVVSLLSLVSPVYFYYQRFGFGLWKEHQDWAHLGSFFGGVLGPLVTLISVLYLGFQFREQVKQNKRDFVNRRCELLLNEAKESALVLSECFKDRGFVEELKKEAKSYNNISDDKSKEKAKLYTKENHKAYYEFVALEIAMMELLELDYRSYETMKFRIMARCDFHGMGALNRIAGATIKQNDKKSCLSF
ncbi:hypothetical protein BTO01_23125 [Vibrio jasicida]|uniref:DUF4760 domain-containing protein n=1 Tax=Vibrio gallaecicus TaxID=552386 RepID=A0ABV4NG52_9VIBR|nr:hypothetical protein [Vibrio jasicida]PQJ55413.1 hypothetical protein BTO01_23125 [Vibrio jasicida]